MFQEDKFHIHKEFFVIDSNNLEQVESKLYGYAILNNILIEDITILGEQDPKGNGAYVCVRKYPEKITIHQDFIGSYGLYLYKEQDYFAISNSFIALLDHIKLNHKITFHQDFANYMISAELCSASFADTMIEEIKLLDRSAIVTISIDTKKIRIDYADYCENTIALNSPEGMSVLDTWYHKWTGLIRNLYKENSNIRIDLSGGFDSRVILALFLGSGIDMNRVYVNSIKDDLHTHSEDYEIASDISKHYGFTLNNDTMIDHDSIVYSMDDSINISFYLKLCFHKQMYPRIRSYTKPLHYFGGSGGECVRSYWNTSKEEYIQKAVSRCGMFSSGMTKELENSTRNILSDSFNKIQEKFAFLGRALDPEDLTLNLYRETRCRNHFGKDLIENYYGGNIKHAPLLDPDLHKLKLNDSICTDKNLLMAVIFDRYNKDLLKFKYDSNRSIDPATIRYAKKLNSEFPYSPSEDLQTSIDLLSSTKDNLTVTKNRNKAITLKEYKETIQEIFYSDRIRSMFELLYSEDLYESISEDINTRKYQPMQNAYTVIGIAKVLQDILTNENIHSKTIADIFHGKSSRNHFSSSKNSLLKDPYLENYVTLRLDIKNMGLIGNDLEILDISDKQANISKPSWFAKRGNGYIIESKSGKLDLSVRCIHSGNLAINVRGRDVRNKDQERIPFWIDLTSFIIENNSKLTDIRPIWHDEPFHLSRKTEDQEEIHIHLEWAPHNECNTKLLTKEQVAHQQKTIKQKIVDKITAFLSHLKCFLSH